MTRGIEGMEERKRAEQAIEAAQDTKAEDVLLVDMDNRSPITDFVLICTGRSQAHVRGIAERIETELKKEGVRYNSMEGFQEGSWVLMDYDVLLVHIFHPETRLYYDLEGLLKDFPSERFSPPEISPDGGDAASAA